MNSILFKKELREKYKVVRKRTYNQINTEASKIVSNYAFKIIQMFKSKIVAGYWPFNYEINCWPGKSIRNSNKRHGNKRSWKLTRF